MSIGVRELLLILVIVVILFGVGKLPRVMAELGKGLRAFKKEVSSDIKDSDGNKVE